MRLFLLTLALCGLFLTGMCSEEDDEIDQIIGGAYAGKGQYPYMVYFMGPTNKLFCSGTLITANKVLTTAWCFPNIVTPSSGVSAWMNTVSLNPDADRVVRRVVGVVRAPDYNAATGLHDIAIATLDSPVLSTSVLPVTLGFGVPVYPGNQAVVVGWGYTGTTQLSTYLRHSYITMQSNSVCSATFRNTYFGSGYFLCAASPGVGSCSLDAGAPILLNGRQVGISSQSRCGGGEPIVAVAVASYERWIRSNV